MNIRYDLIPPQGIEEVSKVLTKKLEKFNINQWKYGISWSEVISSLKKHLTEFELGNDYDDNGLLQIANNVQEWGTYNNGYIDLNVNWCDDF